MSAEIHSVLVAEQMGARIALSLGAMLRDEGPEALHNRLGALADEQRLLVETALKALAALKAGDVGVGGATGAALEGSLLKLRDLIDRALPEIRAASGMVTPRARARRL
jgi:hypothetical protein